MRILITARPRGPLWTYVTELTGGLRYEGVEVVVAVLYGPLEDQQRAHLRRYANIRFFESTYGERELDAAGEWLLDLSARHHVDVVHLNETAFIGLPWRARTVFHAMDYVRDVLAADAVVTPSRAVAEQIMRAGTAKRIRVIPLGRSQRVFPTRTKEPMILTAGDFADPAINVGAVVRVGTRISWPVFILGDSPHSAGVSLANSHFLGGLAASDAAAVLSRASVFAHPARTMAGSFDIIDAANAGCALVLGDIPGLREAWDGAAVFVDPDNDDELRSMLIWLMSDTTACSDLGNRAQHRAAAFNAEQMARAYSSLYIDLSAGVNCAMPDRAPRLHTSQPPS